MEIIRPKVSIESWGESGLRHIENRMDNCRSVLSRQAIKSGDFELARQLSYDTRMLSEMVICESLLQIEPPPGFNKVTRNITFFDPFEEKMYEGEHTFFSRMGSWEEIICLTPGQMVVPQRLDLKPGQRIESLEHRAESLVHRLSGQVVYAHGKKKEFADQLQIYF